jgi:hypothetical protein
MSIEFKAPIPKPGNPRHCPQTVAIYNRGKFIDDPLMRHESYLEIWTGPPVEVDEKGVPKPVLTAEWRQHQRCLAVSHQTSIIIGMRDLGNRNEKATAKTKL